MFAGVKPFILVRSSFQSWDMNRLFCELTSSMLGTVTNRSAPAAESLGRTMTVMIQTESSTRNEVELRSVRAETQTDSRRYVPMVSRPAAVTSARAVQSEPDIGTPNTGRRSAPSRKGMRSGTASPRKVPTLLPMMNTGRGTALAKVRRSVPRSFSPFTASYPKRMAKRVRMTVTMKSRSRNRNMAKMGSSP